VVGRRVRYHRRHRRGSRRLPLDGDATTALASFPASSTALSFTDTTAQTVTVYTLNDTTAEVEEAFDFQLGTITGALGATTTPGSPQTIAIHSSDQPLTITCTAVSGLAALTEGDATTVANCSHGNTEALVADVGVGWEVLVGSGLTHTSTGTAASADFPNGANGALTIPSGTAMGVNVPLMLTATDDGMMEAAEMFSLVITGARDANGRYAVLTPADVNHAQDIEVAASGATNPQFSIAVASTTVSDDADSETAGVQVPESTASVSFTVSLANGDELTADATVDWAITGGTTDQSDATGVGSLGATLGTATFTMANHSTPQTITVNLNDDSVNEPTETLRVTLSSASGAAPASRSASHQAPAPRKWKSPTTTR